MYKGITKKDISMLFSTFSFSGGGYGHISDFRNNSEKIKPGRSGMVNH